jgi:sulfatase modifying factor 1
MNPQLQTEPQLDGHADMVLIPGGTFQMGSDRHYPEEAPVHRVTVAPFRMDRTPVTNRQFRAFVQATGYVTEAEIAPDPKDYPGALPQMLKPGSLVFTPPAHPVDLRNWSQWWRFEFGANWRRPYGRGKANHGLDDHPVVHVAWRDVAAYAAWTGKELPNGSTRPAAASMAPNSPGVTRSHQAAGIWPIPGKAHFRTKIWRRMATPARHRSRRIRQTSMACTT